MPMPKVFEEGAEVDVGLAVCVVTTLAEQLRNEAGQRPRRGSDPLELLADRRLEVGELDLADAADHALQRAPHVMLEHRELRRAVRRTVGMALVPVPGGIYDGHCALPERPRVATVRQREA